MYSTSLRSRNACRVDGEAIFESPSSTAGQALFSIDLARRGFLALGTLLPGLPSFAAEPQFTQRTRRAVFLIDRSQSMAGYVSVEPNVLPNPPPNIQPVAFQRLLESLRLAVTGLSAPSVLFGFGGKGVNRESPERSQLAPKPEWFREPETRIDLALSGHESDQLVILISDLFQGEGDIPRVAEALRLHFLRRLGAIGVIAVHAPFLGKIDPADIGSSLGPRGVSHRGTLPIYAIVAGNESSVKEVIRRVQGSLLGQGTSASAALTVMFSGTAPRLAAPLASLAIRPTASVLVNSGLLSEGRSNTVSLGFHLRALTKNPVVDLQWRIDVDPQDPFSDARLLRARVDVSEEVADRKEWTAYRTASADRVLLERTAATRDTLTMAISVFGEGIRPKTTYRVRIRPELTSDEVPASWASFALEGPELDRLRSERSEPKFAELLAPRLKGSDLRVGRTPNIVSLLRALARAASPDSETQQAPSQSGEVLLYFRRA